MTISNIASYHRPADLESALRLLREGRGRAVPLAGGTDLVGKPDRETEAVVDLRDLRLDWLIEQEEGALSMGAMVTLDRLASDEVVRGVAEGAVAEAARYAAGSLVRNRATVGGTLIARAATSDLVAALLALDASVVVNSGSAQDVTLEEFYRRQEYLLQPGSLLTEVRLPARPEGARVGMARIARTPMDQPIVTVTVMATGESLRVGASGVAPMPCLAVGAVGEAEAVAESLLAGVTVRDDHMASAAYRRAMLPVLIRRALGQG